MRALALLVAGLMILGPGYAIASEHNDAASWRSVATKELLRAYDAGQQPVLRLVLTGPPLPAPAVAPADRAGWMAYWQSEAAPFFSGVGAVAAQVHGKVVERTPAVDTLFVDVPRDAVPRLVAAQGVQSAGLDFLGAVQLVDLLPGPSPQTELKDSIHLIQGDALNSLGYTGAGVKLAMIDTGMLPTHEMLKNADGTTRVVKWVDETTDGDPNGTGYCASPCDDNGHGTHTASTAAGSNKFNPNSPKGVAPDATLYGVRIFQGSSGQWSWAQNGLQDAFNLGADITSNSWGGACDENGGDQTARLAENLTRAGMISVFAAGNSGPGSGSVICPGSADLVTTVGALDINEVVADFSSRGPCTWPAGSSQTRLCPDVMAVGVNVDAAWNSCDTCYNTISGTSMATPHVAGTTVLLEQASEQIYGQKMDAAHKESEVLLRYSAKVENGGINNDYGWGLTQGLNAYNLLSSNTPVNLAHSFSDCPSVIRAYNTCNIALNLAELGSVPLSGTVTIEVRQLDTGACPPTCDDTVSGQALDLGRFTEGGASYNFDGSQHPAGNYQVTATYDYTYTDPVSGQPVHGEVKEIGNFLLKKVYFVKTLVDIGDHVHDGDLIMSGYDLNNRGNENASNVVLTVDFPNRGLVPLPQLPPTDTSQGANGLWASPAPSSVILSKDTVNGVSEYQWKVHGPIDYGTAWDSSFNFLGGLPNGIPPPGLPRIPPTGPVTNPPQVPTLTPGVYTINVKLTYTDEVGHAFQENIPHVFTVGPPLVS